MAFISLPSICTNYNNKIISSSRTICERGQMTMNSNGNMSRRSAIGLFASSLSLIASQAIASEFDLKELKEDVEALKYDEEILDVGPDPQEKNPTRIKKKEKEPSFRAEEAALKETEEKKYEAMVEKELEEDAEIKAKFSKSR